MNIKTFNTVVLLLLLTFGTLTVEAENDDGLPVDIKASLIYVSPGYTAYTAYGHCAIRMQCPSQRLDYCFTYGLDDSSQSYVSFFSGKGKGRFSTFYTHDYLREYKDNNRQVSEYELNLSLDEKRNLWALLDSGISGESIPYDYLKTNCSSMCVRAVESVLDKETIEYKDLPVALLGTYRDFVRHISVHKPWCGFSGTLY